MEGTADSHLLLMNKLMYRSEDHKRKADSDVPNLQKFPIQWHQPWA